MNNDRTRGAALIAASIGFIITMHFHPSGREVLTPAQLEVIWRRSMWVHAFAIAWLPVMFFGALGLQRRFAESQCAVGALIAYGMGSIAVMNAGVLNGFVAPNVYQAVSAASNKEMWQVIIRYSSFVSGPFAQIFVVCSAVAVLLWSVAMLSRRTWLGLAIYGCVAALAILAVLFSGHLQMNVQGFGMAILVQAVWFIWAGTRLWKVDSAQSTA